MVTSVNPPHPPCFKDEEHYQEWEFLNRMSGSLAARDYCGDCTLQYQKKMIDLDKCLHPETEFYIFKKILADGDEESEVVGLRNPTSYQRRFIHGKYPAISV